MLRAAGIVYRPYRVVNITLLLLVQISSILFAQSVDTSCEKYRRYLCQYSSIVNIPDCVRGVARGLGGPCPHPQSSIEWIFYGKNWLCWYVGTALFSKVTLFSLSEVRSVVFCGTQISQIYGPRCWGSSSFDEGEGDDK